MAEGQIQSFSDSVKSIQLGSEDILASITAMPQSVLEGVMKAGGNIAEGSFGDPSDMGVESSGAPSVAPASPNSGMAAVNAANLQASNAASHG